MAASNPNQMEAAQAQVQEVVGVMRNNIDKVVLIVALIIVVLIMRNNIDKLLFVVWLWCFFGMIIHHCEFHILEDCLCHNWWWYWFKVLERDSKLSDLDNRWYFQKICPLWFLRRDDDCGGNFEGENQIQDTIWSNQAKSKTNRQNEYNHRSSRASTLEASSSMFQQSSRRLRKKYWWQ